jgi:transmembrane sensor
VRPSKGADRRAEDRRRREAAAWFARLRGPQADRHRTGFEAWRTADPRHDETYQRLVRRWDDAAVLAERPDSRSSPKLARRVWAPRILVLGGALAAVALIAISPFGPNWVEDWSTLPGSPYRSDTEVGEIRTLSLPDGSKLTLDTDTVVATRFSKSMRLIRLARGRVRVGVAPDAARPFMVLTDSGSVSAQNALFDIWRRADHQIAVTPFQGEIDVTAQGRVRDAVTLFRVRPGQSLAFGPSLASPALRPASGMDTLWPSGRLDFENTPLAAAVDEANRYGRHKIILSDPRLGALQVSGVFRAADTAGLAQSLAGVFGLQVSTDPNGDYVLSPIHSRSQARGEATSGSG